MRLTIAAVVCFIVSSWAPISFGQPKKDPCETISTNHDSRDCYAREQKLANAEADGLAAQIASSLRGEARDAESSEIENDFMAKAATDLDASQVTWKDYRDKHCRAVELSWTTGSGARTAYEECMFNLARQRIQVLRQDFNGYADGSRKPSK